ncbi:MAG: transporter [Lacipirellulaceae bacterium]
MAPTATPEVTPSSPAVVATPTITEPRIASAQPNLVATPSPLTVTSAEPPTLVETPEALPYPERPKIYFRPAVQSVDHSGNAILQPSIRLAATPGDTAVVEPVSPAYPVTTTGPPIESIVPNEWSDSIVEGYGPPPPQTCAAPERPGPVQELVLRSRAALNGPRSPEPGIGVERVVYAPSFVDISQPLNNFRIRLEGGSGWENPDRSEYFWARIDGPRGVGTAQPEFGGAPPVGEREVDFQAMRFFYEIGGDKFSVATDLPIMMVDPEVYDNESGFGDMTITTKTVLLDGRQWQISNLFRIYAPTGNPRAGTGNGHLSLEPGFAFRYKWSDVTYLHSDIKYWIPAGGDDAHAGQVLNGGVALSHVWRDSDCQAVIPTLELTGFAFLNGLETLPGTIVGFPANPAEVDSAGVVNLHPGCRWVWDKGGDCGVQEFGLFSGFALTEQTLWDQFLRFEFRWSW